MTYKQLFEILDATGMSPEQFGAEVGLSGMTLRRWRDLPPGESLSSMYRDAVVRAIRSLVTAGKLSIDAKHVNAILADDCIPFESAAKTMGITSDTLNNFKTNPDGAIETLSQIGGDGLKRDRVDSSTVKIQGFKKMGEDWSYRISRLMSIIRSKDLHTMDKVVAYGALFYLINPFDFIPDSIPVLGFLDDFFFLGIALTFYLKRYPKLFESKK